MGHGKNLCPDKERATIAVVAVLLFAWAPGAIGMMAAILLGALAGLALGKGQVTIGEHLPVPVSRKAGLMAFALFVALLIGLPVLARASARMGAGGQLLSCRLACLWWRTCRVAAVTG